MHEGVELWLVRHGETTRSVAREIAGWSDPPLTEHGRREAEALRPILEGEVFSAVWSSDLQRAVTTSQLAWGEPTQDRRLRELNFGELEESRFDDVEESVAQRILGFRDFDLPGGENRDSFGNRVTGFVDALPPGRHLIFAHGGVIRALTQHLGIDRFLPTCSIVGVDWPKQKVLFLREPEGARAVFAEQA